MSVLNSSNKLSRKNFKEEDLRMIAKVLNCEFESNFIFKDGIKL